MKSVLVVGSLAYDTVQTPFGRKERLLGGSANYFSMAAAAHADVRVVGVIGEDYQKEDLEKLQKKGVNTSGIMKKAGKTFFWEGRYQDDLNEAESLKTELNVFETFSPEVPKEFQENNFVFLANIDPVLQLKVLENTKATDWIAMDTMNFWISSKKQDLLKVLAKVNALFINEKEIRDLSGETNMLRAMAHVQKLGPKTVVVKRGEYGFVLKHHDHFFALPACPVVEVIDPTGAGDTFAGGFFASLAGDSGANLNDETNAIDRISFQAMKRACLRGCVTASFTIQDFGTGGVESITPANFEKRMNEYLDSVSL